MSKPEEPRGKSELHFDLTLSGGSGAIVAPERVEDTLVEAGWSRRTRSDPLIPNSLSTREGWGEESRAEGMCALRNSFEGLKGSGEGAARIDA